MQLSKGVRTGILLIFFGISPLLFTTYELHSHSWEPLRVSLALLPGKFESPDFVTDLNGTYIVSLVFDKLLDGTRQDCLIGWDFPEGTCKDLEPTLDFDWTITGNVTNVENGGHFKIYGMVGSSDDEVQFGRFDGKRGGHHKVQLDILSDAGELNTAHPRLKVEAHHVYFEKWVILNQFAMSFALLAAILGLLNIIWFNRD